MKAVSSCIVCLLAIHVPSLHAQNEEQLNAAICRLDEERIPYECYKLYRSIFAAAGRDGLDKLLLNADDSIAIQSAWEVVQFTVPSEVGDSLHGPDVGEMNWFLGYFEGRMRVSPPKWWCNALRDCQEPQRQAVELEDIVKPDPYHQSGIDSIRCPKDASIEKSGASYLYRVGDNQVTIPDKILVRWDNGELSGHISGCFTSDRCFLAVHGDSGHLYAVACVDRESSKLVWQSTDCAWTWGGASGPGTSSWVSVVHAPHDRVFVFGASGFGFYAFGFDASCGQYLLRFSSGY